MPVARCGKAGDGGLGNLLRRLFAARGGGHLLRRLFAARGGNATVLAAFAVVPMMGGAGLAVDSGRAMMVENRMAKALDAAGLAAGRVLFAGEGEVAARGYFDANFPAEFLGSRITDFHYSVDAAQEFVTVSATATVPTTFMKILGEQAVAVSARTVVERQNRGAELALVMDNTGSMRGGGKMDAMKAAGQELVDIMFGDRARLDQLYVSVVPYTATVNVDADNWDWLDSGDRFHNSPDPFAPTAWKGCVEARHASGRDEGDAPPNVERLTSFYYPANETDNDWPEVKEANHYQNDGTGPNLGCGPAITPLTNAKATVADAIAEMQPWHRGGTTSNLGLAWGWRTLSPRWRGLWGGETPASFPLDYDAPLMDKVVVILTDGVNQFWDNGHDGEPRGSDYTAYGRLQDFMPTATDVDDVVPTLNDKFARACTDMKDRGVIVYTITFGSSAGDAALRELYRSCASDNAAYYHAPDNDTLRQAFRSIGDKLSNLRIVE